jgi:phage shock protein E
MSLYIVALSFFMRDMAGRNKFGILLLLFLSMILVGCTGESLNEWQRLNAVEFDEAIQEIQGAYLLDTRTQSEWENDGHIVNATLIPHDEIDLRVSELPEDKDTTILLYCRSGNRSQTAAQTLLDLGYTDVRDLESGIIGWKNAGYPVEYGP